MKNKNVRALCEGAIMIAMAQVLGYLKFYEFPQGGSVTLAMIPIFFYAVRWGLGKGLLASFVFSLLQLTLDGAYAWSWQSMLLDYILAFSLLGVAGVFRGKKYGVFYGTVLGSFLRFVASTLSGVYVWAEYMPDKFFGMTMTSPWIYSPIYNGAYNGLNMILCLAAFAALYKPLNKYIMARDILLEKS